MTTDFRHTPADHLGGATRGLRDGERDGRPLRVLVLDRSYAATPEEVWSALTSAERVPRWFAPVTGEFAVGGRYQIEGNAGGEILACEAPEHLELTWEFGGDISWVDVRLAPAADGGTALHLEHSAPVPEEKWREFGPGAVGIGWEMMLMGLAEHLADPGFTAEEAQVLMASPEGQAWIGEFMVGSNSAWEQASVDFGTDPDTARAAAASCLAAYTGGRGD
jgi:uncharacterized protein YndB with AHSA1/START domain